MRLEEGVVLCSALPLILGGREPICPEEKPKVCIKDSLTAGSTGKGPRQGGQG